MYAFLEQRHKNQLRTMFLKLFCCVAVLLLLVNTVCCQGEDLQPRISTTRICMFHDHDTHLHVGLILHDVQLSSVASFASAQCSPAIQSSLDVYCGVPNAGTYGPTQSEVTATPLWDAPLPSPQYAGYINIPGTSKHIFYQLIVSQQSPAEDPLVVRCITKIKPNICLWILMSPDMWLLCMLCCKCALCNVHFSAACQEVLEAALLTWILCPSCTATDFPTHLSHRSYLRM